MKIFNSTSCKANSYDRSSPCRVDFDSFRSTSSQIQNELEKHGIESIITGGLAVDLYGNEYVARFTPRDHKDIDFLVEDWVLDYSLLNQKMSALGFTCTGNKHPNCLTFNKGNLEIDFMGYFATDDVYVGEYPLISRSGKTLDKPIPINTQPWLITHENQALSVLTLSSLLDLKKFQYDYRSDAITKRDITILEELLHSKNEF